MLLLGLALWLWIRLGGGLGALLATRAYIGFSRGRRGWLVVHPWFLAGMGGFMATGLRGCLSYRCRGCFLVEILARQFLNILSKNIAGPSHG